MKILFILIFLISYPTYSQEAEIPDEEDVQPIDETEIIDEAENKEEEKAQKEECVCPQEEQAQDSLSTIFPSGSVFVITPETQIPQQPQKQEEKVVPYPTAPLPSGYSDDQFKEIGVP